MTRSITGEQVLLTEDQLAAIGAAAATTAAEIIGGRAEELERAVVSLRAEVMQLRQYVAALARGHQ
jgi:hypothetical protein